MESNCLIPGDLTLIENIVNYLKAKGLFDEFRHECLADVDTKSSCQNLSQRVDGYASKFLANETWHADLNKNELRNKLRRHIDEAGFLALGADIVVEQAINPKVFPYFFPKVIDMVRQYVTEQGVFFSKKAETISSSRASSTSEKSYNDAFENKDKAQILDPIADILSFSLHSKVESNQHKHGDSLKVERKKEDKNIPAAEKCASEIQSEAIITPISEGKLQLEKDKIKNEDPENQQEILKKTVKDEIKSEKKKADDAKVCIGEIATTSEESKPIASISSKSNMSSKKDDKYKHKSKSQNSQKSSNSTSELKKSKKEPSEKHNKIRSTKPSKESSSPTKISSSYKSVFKEEKGESSKTKLHDTSSTKTSETAVKKSKSNSDKKESSSSKHKGHEKSDKQKVLKSLEKNETYTHHDLSSSEKSSKSLQYSSSYDSSQGSDQEKNISTNSKTDRLKHFSKHASKENSEQPANSNKTTDKKRTNSGDESPSKKFRNEKDTKFKLKDTPAVEAAKISSRSNSFGSTSSVSSSSNASKDNSTSNSDEVSENSAKDKKKKQLKEKDSCQNFPKTLPPPPPPPPPSSSLTSEATSAAEMSSMEDTQSSLNDSETSGSEDISEEFSSDSELESKDLIHDTLNENSLNSSIDNINAFYDIFLYSSSSSEFEGYGNSPEKKNFKNEFCYLHESDVSISSVHTSDLSSFDDELSSDDEVADLTGGLKKRLTLKEAQELIENRASLNERKKTDSISDVPENSLNKRCSQRSASCLSSDEDESPPTEPIRSLRRERKLNPRYSSSEYTSIFNCKKETFITKQTSPSVRSQASSSPSSPKVYTKWKKNGSYTENNKLAKENLTENENVEMHSDEVKTSEENRNPFIKDSQDKDDQLDDSKMSNSDEFDSVIVKEQLFKENNKNNLIMEDDKLKNHRKLRKHNNSNVRRNSHSLKRKLEVTDSTPIKRPCNRSSLDSSSSELVPNENKPFNSEKKDFNEEKKLSDCSLKVSNLNIGVKKDLFNKQRTNNNGDVLGQKDIFPKNSHNRIINNNEKKANESDTSKELSSL